MRRDRCILLKASGAPVRLANTFDLTPAQRSHCPEGSQRSALSVGYIHAR